MQDPDFRLVEEAADHRTLLRAVGDLDVLSAAVLRDRLVGLIAAGTKDLVADLSAVEFIDSSGMSALVTGHKRAASAGGRLAVVAPKGPVRRIIEVVSLDHFLELYETVEEVPPAPPSGSPPAA